MLQLKVKFIASMLIFVIKRSSYRVSKATSFFLIKNKLEMSLEAATLSMVDLIYCISLFPSVLHTSSSNFLNVLEIGSILHEYFRIYLMQLSKSTSILRSLFTFYSHQMSEIPASVVHVRTVIPL